MEEAGVAVAVERLIAVGERLPTPHSRAKDHAVFFLFNARIKDGTPTVTDDDEIVRFKWVDVQEANVLLSHWKMDFAVHREYRALYYAAEWEERD
jgi:hypothetical protein